MAVRTFSIFLVSIIIVAINVLPAQSQQDSTKKKNNIRFTGIPIISYNSSYGVIFGANGMAFFNVNKSDTISPASQAGIGLGYTQNKSFFGSAFAQLYFKENRWRTTAAFGTGNINFQYFEAANEADGGDFVDYNTVNRFLFLKVLRKIAGHLYGGAFMKLQHSTTSFKVASDSSQDVHANGVGLTLLYDTRKNIYSPDNGIQASISFLANPPWLGSDSIFNSIRAFVNWYHRLNKQSILAVRGAIFSGLGNVPFSGQHAVGGKDIRGYTNGKYRGDQVYSAQAEYRWTFYKRWGAVGFAGVAFTEAPYSGLLPGGGIGIRFKAIPSRNVNIGIDGAIGKGDKGIYFRINEAF